MLYFRDNKKLFEVVAKQVAETNEEYEKLMFEGELTDEQCAQIEKLELLDDNIKGLENLPNLNYLKVNVFDEDNIYRPIPVEFTSADQIKTIVSIAETKGTDKIKLEDIAPKEVAMAEDRLNVESNYSPTATPFVPQEETPIQKVVIPPLILNLFGNDFNPENNQQLLLPLSAINNLQNDPELLAQLANDENISFNIMGTNSFINGKQAVEFNTLINQFKEAYDFKNLSEPEKIGLAFQFARDENFLNALGCIPEDGLPYSSHPDFDATVCNVFSAILGSENIPSRIMSVDKIAEDEHGDLQIVSSFMVCVGDTLEDGKIYDPTLTDENGDVLQDYQNMSYEDARLYCENFENVAVRQMQEEILDTQEAKHEAQQEDLRATVLTPNFEMEDENVLEFVPTLPKAA